MSFDSVVGIVTKGERYETGSERHHWDSPWWRYRLEREEFVVVVRGVEISVGKIFLPTRFPPISTIFPRLYTISIRFFLSFFFFSDVHSHNHHSDPVSA